MLQSTSFDDGGLVLTQYEWAVVSGGTGTLVTDGGAQALFTLPPVAFSAPDVLTGIELRVTNAVGARSNPARQFYTVRGIAPGNWTLDAGTQQSILVTASPPQVQLSAAITTSVASPQYSVSWACTPSMPLLSGDTLAPRFVAPAISGANQVVSCQVTATGQAPLDPPSLSGAVNNSHRDGTPPAVVSHNIEPTRMGRFGFLVRASERLASATFSAGCTGVSYGFVEEVVGRAMVAGTAYSVLSTGGTCGSATVSMTDTAASPLTVNNVPFGPSTSSAIQEEWAGPFESALAYDDPRPVVTSLGILPSEAQFVAGASTSTPGYELLGASGTDFVRLSGLDVTQWPTCNPTCPLTATALNLPAGTVNPVGAMQRSFHGGAQLFVVSGSDGGVVPEVIRRTENGTWAPFTGLTGAPGVWNGTLRAARADDGGQVLLDTYTPSTGAFTPNDVAATGLSDISLLSTTEDYLAIVSGVSKTLLARYRNPSSQVWSTKTTGTAPTGITALQVTNMQGLALAVMQTATGLSVVRLDSGSNLYALSSTPVAGFDVADWGQNVYVVYATGGDIRLKTIAGSVWSGAGGGPVDFGGPPRAGFPTPYPLVLDGDPLCEAAWPRMAFIDGVLVVVWQERCSPATQWKIMARLVR
ncbi:MAG: hypothetical protein JNG84_05145 [Archangium sp.]|nr:hypothetical protein [Archangium sp.]